MHIAYSALREININPTNQYQEITHLQTNHPQISGYLAACAKYSREITAIQQYIPGLMPSPPVLKEL
ncbi:MAG: hypothetical protein EOP47_29315 [Sphingobacteriaceae bacterium]|nr:MAG: hypothetical protein EOP47_29315 [Sphingobacteriaceae bacterium]